MQSVTLRRAAAADAARAFRLFERLQAAEHVPVPLRLDETEFRRRWLGDLGAEFVFAVSDDGCDRGFCACFRDWFIEGFEDALYMSAIYAEPGFRCRGVGRACTAWLRCYARSMGRSRLVWCVRADNQTGCLFSTALGACAAGERRISERGVTMALRLFFLPA